MLRKACDFCMQGHINQIRGCLNLNSTHPPGLICCFLLIGHHTQSDGYNMEETHHSLLVINWSETAVSTWECLIPLLLGIFFLYIWRVYLQTDNSFFMFKNHNCIVLVSSFFTLVKITIICYFALIGMHIEKTWFLRIVKNVVICFCKLTLHIYIYIYILYMCVYVYIYIYIYSIYIDIHTYIYIYI